MTIDILILLVIVGASAVLFSLEPVPPDVTALGILLALILTGLLTPEEAFSGFGSGTVLMILGLLILTAALARTGVVEMVGRAILRHAGETPDRLQPVVMLSASALSAFLSNTAATAFFLPVVVGLARRLRIRPSQLLMPLAFAAILASSVTLIASSTNILVSGLLVGSGQEPIGMFELAPVGLPIALMGMVYLLTLGRRLMPTRPTSDELTEEFGLRSYLTEVDVLSDSPLVGKTLAQSGLGRDHDITILGIIQGGQRDLQPGSDTRLQANDLLLIEGPPQELLRLDQTVGLRPRRDAHPSDPELQAGGVDLVEAILLPGSPLIGRTLRGFHFRESFGLQVLAIHRKGESLRRRIAQMRLRLGDILLIQGDRRNLASLEADQAFRILGPVEQRPVNRGRAPWAAAAFTGSVVMAALGWVPLPVAVLLGAFIVLATGCITTQEAYREVEWKAIIVIGGMLALGEAMEQTGAAEYLAGRIVSVVGLASPLWLLGAFFLLTVSLTQPMSNQAAAVVVLPFAMQTALLMDLNPRTFAMMVAVGASCSFLTPLEPACMMVYGPGRYRFTDFLKVGSILTVLIFVLALVLVPRVWPL
jgi:di/tricarboxylate transporter